MVGWAIRNTLSHKYHTMNAIEVFRHAKPSEDLAKSVTLRVTDKGAKRLGLLPAVSKSGPSLKSVSGLTGQALKRWKRERAAELKTAMAREFGGLASDAGFVGRSITVSASGVIGFFLEPSEVPAVDTSKLAEAEEKTKALEKELAALKAKLSESEKAALQAELAAA